MRKRLCISYFSLFFILAFLIDSCSPLSQPVQGPTASPTEAEISNVLNIYNWDTYIDPAILTGFEQKYKITINYTTYQSNEEMLDAVKSQPTKYDLIVPTDYMVSIMKTAGLLAPLNKQNIPNFGNLDPAFINTTYDPANRYCAPYQWGTQGIGYNIQATKREITSWKDIFDPAYSKRISLLDDSRSTIGIVLLLLGYSPNTSNKTELNEAVNFLKENKKYIAYYAEDDGQDLLLEGKVDLAFEYSGDILQIMEEESNIRYVIPKEGALIWTDNMCIPANARHKDAAEKFINYILDANNGALLSNFTRYSSPNKASLPMISPEDLKNPTIYPSEDSKRNLYFLADIGSDMTDSYNQAWSEIMADFNH